MRVAVFFLGLFASVAFADFEDHYKEAEQFFNLQMQRTMDLATARHKAAVAALNAETAAAEKKVAELKNGKASDASDGLAAPAITVQSTPEDDPGIDVAELNEEVFPYLVKVIGERAYFMVGDQEVVVKEKDTVEGYVVKTISLDSAVLVRSGKEYTASLRW